MILNLTDENEFRLNLKDNIKKLETLTQKNTVLFNKANWCGHCQVFAPQWEEFKRNIGSKVNIVEIESSILNKIKDDHKNLYKRVTPSSGAVYFPMIIIYIKKGNKIEKKLYENNRDAKTLQNHVEEKLKKSVNKKLTTTTSTTRKTTKRTEEKAESKDKKGGETKQTPLSLFEINRELQNILNELNYG